jgi:pyruvate,orthophosphate dikinase
MQDIEFTVERGKLWMLQTRSASAPPRRRSDRGRHGERGLITQEEAILRVDPRRSTSCSTRRSIPARRAT